MERTVFRGLVPAAIVVVLYAGITVAAAIHALSNAPTTPPAVIKSPQASPSHIQLQKPSPRSKTPPGKSTVNSRSGFVHPGVLVTRQQLDYVSAKINEGAEPWSSAFEAMRSSRYASLSWSPRPRSTIECGAYSQPDRGCLEEREDAVAAYTHALMWYLTSDRRHAKKSIEILDAWSAEVRRHTNANAPLQAAWSAASFVRAAELMKHTYDGWDAAHVKRAKDMFRKVYLPVVIGGSVDTGGNWELIMMDAAIGIGVFLDDRATFDRAVATWRARIAAYIYLKSDGPLPKSPPGGPQGRAGIVAYWFGQTRFVDGLAQETCRDLPHTGWGLTAAAHVAETAWIQGLDLYAEARARLTKSLEFHAAYSLGKAVPSWLCGGSIQGRLEPLPEVAYNHYATRLKLRLPETRKLIEKHRPQRANFFYGWETLTHANNSR